MKNLLALLLLTLQLIFSWNPLAQAQTAIPPKPTTNIYVQDYAKVLSSQTKATINAYSSAIADKTKAQIVVVTIPTLDGAALENFSLDLMRQWGIGDKEKNNGVLLLVAVQDRQSRIEVGYGLEGALPDGLTGRIQDQVMLPLFKKGDYDKGIMQGYASIANTVIKEYNLTATDLKVDRVASSQTNSQSGNLAAAFVALPWWIKLLLFVGFAGLMLVDQIFFGGIILHTILILFMRGGGRGGGGSFGGGSGGGGGSSRRW
ncbi:MAG: TPM domain-containing protein [Acidaminococcaceae bacterium]|nr:TPM domain-containing protein [Acidaminococcaceae bacterium]MDD4722663.1 TPM domain-containing protein [Acidaminococcaceae bacterium]